MCLFNPRPYRGQRAGFCLHHSECAPESVFHAEHLLSTDIAQVASMSNIGMLLLLLLRLLLLLKKYAVLLFLG